MSAARRPGERVTVRGTAYRITSAENLSQLGSKWFGRFRWTLEDDDGNRVTVTGKAIAHNSRVYPAKEPTP